MKYIIFPHRQHQSVQVQLSETWLPGQKVPGQLCSMRFLLPFPRILRTRILKTKDNDNCHWKCGVITHLGLPETIPIYSCCQEQEPPFAFKSVWILGNKLYNHYRDFFGWFKKKNNKNFLESLTKEAAKTEVTLGSRKVL